MTVHKCYLLLIGNTLIFVNKNPEKIQKNLNPSLLPSCPKSLQKYTYPPPSFLVDSEIILSCGRPWQDSGPSLAKIMVPEGVRTKGILYLFVFRQNYDISIEESKGFLRLGRLIKEDDYVRR